MKLTPHATANAWRGLAVVTLAALWLGDGDPAGTALLLFLCVATAARVRLSLPAWTVLADQLAVVTTAAYWPGAWFALALPVFDTIHSGRSRWALPAVAAVAVHIFPVQLGIAPVVAPIEAPVGVLAALAQAAFPALLIREWARERQTLHRQADEARAVRYQLERSRNSWFAEQVRTAREAQLTERDRIAREIHDQVGHKITGASLAVRALEDVTLRGSPKASAEAREMLRQVRERLDESAARLREAVRNMKPVRPVGPDRMREVCHAFAPLPVELNVRGDTTRVPPWVWGLLEPCLQEGLTNAARHAPGAGVDAAIEATPRIVRLRVHNPRVQSEMAVAGAEGLSARLPVRAPVAGVGLRGLRQRVRAVGGSVATDTTDGFTLICVLPLDGEEGVENRDR